MAMRQLGLDQVWWLVSPQNPLKSAVGMAPMGERLKLARKATQHPRIFATDIETELNTRFTIDTVCALQDRFPKTHFVWLMGADNMIELPRWKNWRALMETIPIAVYPRPGFTLKARLSPAVKTFPNTLLDGSDAKALATRRAPALCFLEGPQSNQSATAIRHQNDVVK